MQIQAPGIVASPKFAYSRLRNFVHVNNFSKVQSLACNFYIEPKNFLVNGEAFVNCPYSTGSDTLRGCLDTSAL